MDDLIIHSLQGRTVPREEEELRHWLEEDHENERFYRKLAALWDLVGVAEMLRVGGRPPEATEVIALGEEPRPSPLRKRNPPAIRDPEPRLRSVSRVPTWRRAFAFGAIAASVAAVGFGLGSVRAGDTGLGPLDSGEITTGPGERATITLGDGTAIRLGPESQMRVTQEADQPVVWLEGRAFFGVVPNPTRSFTVRTQHGEAIALGTRFEVRSEDEEFRVLVVEGSVRVSSAGAAIDLGEGLMSQNGPGAPPATSRVENVDEMLDWIGRTLMFRSTRLDRAASEIGHQYGVRVVLKDPALGGVEVTATFTDKTLEEVMYVLCEIIGAEYEIDGSQVSIQRKPGTSQSSAI